MFAGDFGTLSKDLFSGRESWIFISPRFSPKYVTLYVIVTRILLSMFRLGIRGRERLINSLIYFFIH